MWGGGSFGFPWYINQGTHGTGKTGKMAQKNPCQGKHREFGNFVKTQVKVKDIAIFAAKKKLLQKLDRSAKSVLCM